MRKDSIMKKKTLAIFTATVTLAVGNIGVLPRDLTIDFALSASAVRRAKISHGRSTARAR